MTKYGRDEMTWDQLAEAGLAFSSSVPGSGS